MAEVEDEAAFLRAVQLCYAAVFGPRLREYRRGLLERRGTVGGAAVTDERWPGYHVSSAAYVVSLMPPEVVKELELERFGYRVTLLDPDYWVPFPDGTALTLWGDLEKTAAEIARFSKEDAESYRAFDQYFNHLGRLMKDLLFEIPPNLTPGELPRWLALAARLRHWSRRDLAEIVRLFTISGADFLDEWFQDERVKGALGTQTILGAWCGPMSPGSAYVLLHHWFGEVDGQAGAWGWVHGGMGALARSIADSARAAGATLRTAPAGVSPGAGRVVPPAPRRPRTARPGGCPGPRSAPRLKPVSCGSRSSADRVRACPSATARRRSAFADNRQRWPPGGSDVQIEAVASSRLLPAGTSTEAGTSALTSCGSRPSHNASATGTPLT